LTIWTKCNNPICFNSFNTTCKRDKQIQESVLNIIICTRILTQDENKGWNIEMQLKVEKVIASFENSTALCKVQPRHCWCLSQTLSTMLIDIPIYFSFVVKFFYCQSTSGDQQHATLRGFFILSVHSISTLTSSFPLCLFRSFARANLRAKDHSDRVIW